MFSFPIHSFDYFLFIVVNVVRQDKLKIIIISIYFLPYELIAQGHSNRFYFSGTFSVIDYEIIVSIVCRKILAVMAEWLRRWA